MESPFAIVTDTIPPELPGNMLRLLVFGCTLEHMFESSESSSERVVARDARGFDEAGLDVDGFAPECPFPDVELSEVLD